MSEGREMSEGGRGRDRREEWVQEERRVRKW